MKLLPFTILYWLVVAVATMTVNSYVPDEMDSSVVKYLEPFTYWIIVATILLYIYLVKRFYLKGELCMPTVGDLPLSLPDKTGYVEDISKYDYLNLNLDFLPPHYYDKVLNLFYYQADKGGLHVQVDVDSLSLKDVKGGGVALLDLYGNKDAPNYKISFKDLRLLILARQGVLKIEKEV